MSLASASWDVHGHWIRYTPSDKASWNLRRVVHLHFAAIWKELQRDLQDGDLKMTVDFRRVYASVLEDWLGLPSKPALAGTFERLPLFRA